MKKRRSWSNSAPKTVEERLRLYSACGPQAFLDPASDDPGRSGYPVMAKGTKTCAFDCRGLRAAFSRARQQGNSKVAAKALKLGRELRCTWTS